METWKVIPCAPNYSVSDLGRVRRDMAAQRTSIGRIRSTYKTDRGYVYVSLAVDGKPRGFQVHRLVMLAHVGPSTLTVNHKNGDKSDNRLCNLEYVTRRDNSIHAYEVLEVGPRGSSHHNAKLTENDIGLLWSLVESGLSPKEVGRRFGVTGANVSHIVKGKGWRRVSQQLGKLPATN